MPRKGGDIKGSQDDFGNKQDKHVKAAAKFGGYRRHLLDYTMALSEKRYAKMSSSTMI